MVECENLMTACRCRHVIALPVITSKRRHLSLRQGREGGETYDWMRKIEKMKSNKKSHEFVYLTIWSCNMGSETSINHHYAFYDEIVYKDSLVLCSCASHMSYKNPTKHIHRSAGSFFPFFFCIEFQPPVIASLYKLSSSLTSTIGFWPKSNKSIRNITII